MNDLFRQEVLRICNGISMRLRSGEIATLQPIHRKQIYSLAFESAKPNFLKWLEIVVCEKYAHHLENTFLYFYQEKLQVMKNSISSSIDEELFFRSEFSTLLMLGEVINDYHQDDLELRNAMVVAFTIVRAMETIFDQMDRQLWVQINDETFRNTNLDIYTIDASAYITILWHRKEPEEQNYWLWWLEEAIPQALEKIEAE